MKMALFSDVHGNITGLEAVFGKIDQLGGVEQSFCLGDMLGGSGGTDEVYDLLTERNVQMVRGNHEELVLDFEANEHKVQDQWRDHMTKEIAWVHEHLSDEYKVLVANLPLHLEVEAAPGRKLFLCHAGPKDPWAWVCAPQTKRETLKEAFGDIDADVVARGHFHGHHIRKLDEKLLLNVASVGVRQDGLSAFTLLEFRQDDWIVQQHLVPYDVQQEQDLIRRKGTPQPQF